MKISRRRLARQAAVQALYQWQMNPGHCTEIELQFTSDPERLQGADVAFFKSLWQGVCAAIPELDPAIAQEVQDRRWADEVSEVERAILRLAAYELRDYPQTPYRVIIDEAIELGKDFGGEQGHRFVNAVLDKLAQKWRAPETLQAGR